MERAVSACNRPSLSFAWELAVATILFPLPVSAAPCSIAGQLSYSAGILQYCDGGQWTSMKNLAAGSCSAPGQLILTASDYSYCDGTTAWSIRGSSIAACSVHGQISWDGKAPNLCLSGTLYRAYSPPTAPPADPSVFFVSTAGNDSWSGHFADPQGDTDGPFRTLEHAVQALNAYGAAATSKGATLYIRGGTYYLGSPLVLTQQASGSPTRYTVIENYPGEQVFISGGVPLGGWIAKPGSAVPNLFQALSNLSASELGSIFETLRVQTSGYDTWASSSRWPKKSNDVTNPDWQNQTFWLYANGPPAGGAFNASTNYLTIPLSASDSTALSQWDLSSAQILYFPLTYSVYNLPVWQVSAGVSPAISVLTGPYGATSAAKGMRFALSNIADAITNAYEWAINRKSGIVYFKNPVGEDINAKTFVLSRLTNLLTIRGTSDSFAQYISVRGITFEDTSYLQNDYLPFNTLDFGVDISFARSVLFQGNRFQFMGGSGLCIRNSSTQVAVRENVFNHIGQAAIELLSSSESVSLDASHAPSAISIQGNYIYDANHMGKLGAIYVFSATNSVFEGNLVFLGGGSGIQIMGMPYSVSAGNRISYNDIHTVNYGIADSGGIYLTSNDTSVHNNQVLNNRILNVQGAYSNTSGQLISPSGGVGIYLDNMESGDIVSGNIVSQSNYGSVFIHGGSQNGITSNLLINGGDHELQFGGNWGAPALHDNLFFSNVIGVTGANFFATNTIWTMGLDPGTAYSSAFASGGNWFTVPDPSGVKASNTGPVVFYKDTTGAAVGGTWTSWTGTAAEDTNSTLAGPPGEFWTDPSGHVLGLVPGSLSASGMGPQPSLITGLGYYNGTYQQSAAKKSCITGLLSAQMYAFPANAMPNPDSVFQCYQ